MDSDSMDLLINNNNNLNERLSKIQDENERDLCVQDYLKHVNSAPITCDFPPGAEWFNVSDRLTLSDLEGKIVVLDFFTYCCINCMHILPDLKALEEEYPVQDGVVVVGVHSAKFENEKQSQNILSAVQRYNISHPVVNDANAIFWNNLNICCWPTLLILGPNANPIFILMGEGHRDELFFLIRNSLKFYKTTNNINQGYLSALSQKHEVVGSLLRFPGKVTCFGNMLAISDTGNNRILISTLDGTITHVIGGNGPGLQNGDFQTALFNTPQGVVFESGTILYVADTENHAIRQINLESKQVTTIAGPFPMTSPWDLTIFTTPDLDLSFHTEPPIVKKVLLVAMAGAHQIWALFLEDLIWWKFKKYSAGTCVAIVGSGKEENRNNLYPHASGFAQPSGLALDGQHLYVADSESSSIRRVCLDGGKVEGVVGGNRSPTNLFDFGDIDGKQYDAKLQHPLGVATCSSTGAVYIVDSYNHKIKKIDPQTNTVMTLTKKSSLNEPGGLCVLNSKTLVIADTNNHLIKFYDIASQKFKVLSLKLSPETNNNELQFDHIIECNFNLILNLHFEFGNVKLTEGAPHRVNNLEFSNPMRLEINPDDVKNNRVIKVAMNLVICSGNICRPLYKQAVFKLKYKDGAKDNFNLGFKVTENQILFNGFC